MLLRFNKSTQRWVATSLEFDVSQLPFFKGVEDALIDQFTKQGLDIPDSGSLESEYSIYGVPMVEVVDQDGCESDRIFKLLYKHYTPPVWATKGFDQCVLVEPTKKNCEKYNLGPRVRKWIEEYERPHEIEKANKVVENVLKSVDPRPPNLRFR